MKFRLNSFNGCQVTERTRNSIANDQREITPKIYKAELWFLCMTHLVWQITSVFFVNLDLWYIENVLTDFDG